jgi:hypothetical protein
MWIPYILSAIGDIFYIRNGVLEQQLPLLLQVELDQVALLQVELVQDQVVLLVQLVQDQVVLLVELLQELAALLLVQLLVRELAALLLVQLLLVQLLLLVQVALLVQLVVRELVQDQRLVRLDRPLLHHPWLFHCPCLSTSRLP